MSSFPSDAPAPTPLTPDPLARDTFVESDLPAPVAAWHAIAESRDPVGLDELLGEDCVFVSPAVHAPQEGKARATAYLTAAIRVLGPSLAYRDEWYADGADGGSAVLEFTAEVGGREVHGIDLLRWGSDQRLTSFTVMVRPLRGLEALVEQMGRELTGGTH